MIKSIAYRTLLFMLTLLGCGEILLAQDRETNSTNMGLQKTEKDADSSVVRITSIQDVISKWKSNRHLFVKGDIGVGEEQLQKLHVWLVENGLHWTVVLLENASGEVYNAPDGRVYVGMDAVEYALGHGLSNQTAFGEWVNPETKESDGAIFALFLKERKFSYFASDAQDRRRLGEANWIGQLDQPAFRAMRNGGRILDAVKDTVQYINGRLATSIQAEAADKQRREADLQRTLAVLQSALEETERSIDKVDRIGSQWKSEFETATGPMARPPLSVWREKVAEIRNQLEQKNISAATQLKANVVTEIDQYLNMYAASADFESQRKQIELTVNGYRTSIHEVAQKGSLDVEKIIDQAKRERSQGSFDFVETLRLASQKVVEIQTEVEKEIERLRQEEVRANLIRSAVWGTSAFFLAILALVLYVLHRRRTPLMKQAIQEIHRREKSIQEETEQIDQLFERNRVLLGSEERVNERGYTGRTKEVAVQALQYVDDLFIMSREIRRVLADAKHLVEPSSWSMRLLNLFSGRKYQEAIHLVTGAQLGFYAETGVPRILKDFSQHKKANDTSFNGDDIEVSFEDVYTAIDQRGNEAQQRLDLFEKSLTSIDGILVQLQQDVEAVGVAEKELHRLFVVDGLFGFPSLLQTNLPALQAELKQADDQSGFDAVGAIEGPVASLTRKLSQIKELTDIARKFRETDLPLLVEAEKKIAQMQYQTSWMGLELEQLSDRANRLLEQLLLNSITDELRDYEKSLSSLTSKSRDIVVLAERVEKEILPSFTQLHQSLEAARISLSERLKLSAEQIFEESEQDPDDHQRQAVKDIQAAKVLLNEGQFAGALQAAEAAVKERDLAETLVKSSLSAVEEFGANAEETGTRREMCLKMAGELNERISNLAEQYQARAFLLETGVTAENSDRSASELLRTILVECEKIEQRSQEATQSLDSGKVLKAADIQRQCLEHIEWLEQQSIRIEEHLQEVESVASKNVSHFVRQQSETASWEAFRDDPLVCEKTLIDMSKLQDQIARLERDVLLGEGSIPSPFDTEEKLELFDSEIEKMTAAFIADRQAHAEAKRAVEGAERQLQVALRSAAQSQADNIPDSPLTLELNRKIQNLREEWEDLQRELHIPHGDWHILDDGAAKLQSKLVSSGQQLNVEMETAKNALAAFEVASKSVFQAEQWSGPWGLRVTGSPGAQDLERARYGLQSGNYSMVLEISRLAAMAAQAAIDQMEREVRRRKSEADRAAEQRRRDRERSTRSSMGFSSGRSSSSSSFSSSSRSSSFSSSSSSRSSSGFSRSGW